LNSAESPIYHKSRLLYGLNWAKSGIVVRDTSVVVEGYTDVIGMHMAGMPIAVATCGTALVEGHLDLLRRFSERVVLAFDADEAGAGAALRGFERSVPGDLDLRVATLPEGKDPADFVAEDGIEAMEAAVGSSVPLLQFRIDAELRQYDLTEPEARTRAIRAVAAVISLHPDPVARHEYAVMVSRETGVETRLIEQAMRAERSARPRPPTTTPTDGAPDPEPPPLEPQPVPRTASYATEVELLRVLLANDDSLNGLDISAEMFTNAETLAGYEVVSDIISGLAPGQAPDLGSAFGSDDSPNADFLRRLALDGKPIADPADLVMHVKVSAIEREIDDVEATLQKFDRVADEQGYSELWARLIALQQSRRDLRRTE
jgi:DNA primase